MELKRVEDIVRKIITKNKIARIDDMALYYFYVKEVMQGATDEEFKNVFKDSKLRKKYKLSPYGSVSRCRRKLQEKEPHLRPTEKQIKAIREREKEFKEYARA